MKKSEWSGEKQESPITVQVASPADAEGIGHVHAETWLTTYPNEEYGITREDIEAKIETRRLTRADHWEKTIEDKTGNKRVWVAKDEKDEIIGFCLAVKDDDENKIQAIYVLPTRHGGGVGRKLILEAFNWLGSGKPTSLSVAKYNAKVIEFYKKLGFEEVGDAPTLLAAKTWDHF